MKIKLSAIALVLANLIPLAGVLWMDWRVFDVMILYWAENVVIGAVNVLRMMSCGSVLGLSRMARDEANRHLDQRQQTDLSRMAAAAKYFFIPFFIIHYGGFCFGHYSAVVGLFGKGLGNSDADAVGFGVPLAEVWHSPLWIGVFAIVVSHLLSYYFNFIKGGEYQRTDLIQLMKRPYGRIIALHISVIAGGFLVIVLGDPLWMLLVLIAIKISIDLRMHVAERRLFGLIRSAA